MASRATVLRQKSSEKVAAAGRTYQSRIAEATSSRFGEGAGAAAATLVAALTDDLEAKTAAMVAADDAHEAELRDDPAVRSERDTATNALRDKMVLQREQLTAICGAPYVASLGFLGKTPADPVEVLRLGRTLADNLGSTAAPSSLIPGYTMDAASWRDELLPFVENLEGLTTRVAVEEKEAAATLTAKYAAIETYDEAFSSAANLVSLLLSIAGETDLASRVRPSTRRPGQTAEDAPSEGSVDEDATV